MDLKEFNEDYSEESIILTTEESSLELAFEIDDCTIFEDLKCGEYFSYKNTMVFIDADAYRTYLKYRENQDVLNGSGFSLEVQLKIAKASWKSDASVLKFVDAVKGMETSFTEDSEGFKSLSDAMKPHHDHIFELHNMHNVIESYSPYMATTDAKFTPQKSKKKNRHKHIKK